MINIRTIRALANDDGITLKDGKKIAYRTGWQVADHGVEARTAEECMQAVKRYNGTCGVWFSDGIYYVDHSFRVNTKREAMTIGKQCNQISVLSWKTMKLAYCK